MAKIRNIRLLSLVLSSQYRDLLLLSVDCLLKLRAQRHDERCESINHAVSPYLSP
jgi:hypothetical protein